MKIDKLTYFFTFISVFIFIYTYPYLSNKHYQVDINFFVGIAAFYGVVLGFLVPLSKKEIRETKAVVPEHLIPDFEAKTNIISLAIHLSIGLFLNILFISLFVQLKENNIFLTFILITFIHFIFILIQVFHFTKALHRYTIPQNIFDILEQEVSDVIKK
ncbi:MAG: hypothetical protein NTY39_07400 [Campylobacterales bacterium]|nr:hypothetical protein [Campylobacterales bacterium]